MGWHAATGTEITRLQHDSQPTALAFSADGTRIAVGVFYRKAQIFDAATGTELARLDHDDPVYAVAFSPDGTRLATGSDRSARVFDAATGTELARLDHEGQVTAVAFSPDGTRLVTRDRNDSVRVWWVSRDRLIEQALARLTRNLTEQEWRRYFRAEPYRKPRPDLP